MSEPENQKDEEATVAATEETQDSGEFGRIQDELQEALESKKQELQKDDSPTREVATKEPEDVEDEADEEFSEDDSEQASGDEVPDEDEVQAPAGPSKSTVEKAIRAGLSIEDAEAFPTDGALARAVDLLESARKPDTEAEPKGEDSGEESDGLFDSLPELKEEDWDPELLGMVNGMRDMLIGQHKELQALRADRETISFRSRLDSLGEGVAKALQKEPARESAVNERYNVLKAGYESVGKDLSDEAILKEAAEIELGDAMANANKNSKAKRAKNRQGQFTNRPRRHDKEASHQGTSEDARVRIAEEIDKKLKSFTGR